MPASPAEKILTSELLVGLVAVTVGSIRRNQAAPKPTQFVGLVGSFTILAAIAALLPSWGKLASGFGGLIILAIVVGDSKDLLGATSGVVKVARNANSTSNATLLSATPVDSTILPTSAPTGSAAPAQPAPQQQGVSA